MCSNAWSGPDKEDFKIEKYNDAVKDEIGLFNKYEKALNALVWYPNVIRTIPWALKDKVKTEINRLVSSNILVPIDYSEWVTLIIPILKSNGTVKMCNDFKITTNTV